MITRMAVENFKALRRVEVDLGPLTVLIGPNDSGKSSFLEAVYAVAESTRSELLDCFWSPWSERDLVCGQTPDTAVRFSVCLAPLAEVFKADSGGAGVLCYDLAVTFPAGRRCYVAHERVGNSSKMVELSSEGKWETGISHQKSHPLWRSLHRATLARWSAEELATPSALPPDRPFPFDPSGYGLATCIAEMKLGREQNFAALREEFCRHFPAFTGIEIRRATVTSVVRNAQFQKQSGAQGEGYALVLVRKDGVEVPAGAAAGGILVTLAFLTLAHLPKPRKLLLIEEPENGLHPGLLKDVIKLLRQLVTSVPDSQIILTTHSPLLLDYLHPEEVRVFLRDELGEVVVHNLKDVPDIHERLRYLMLGELVYNEGEAELVKEIQDHAHPRPR
jgi:ABC-type branched-subunit amino acid transport system ATPase component